MPNWVENKVSVECSKTFQEVLDFIKSDAQAFDFESILPIPSGSNINWCIINWGTKCNAHAIRIEGNTIRFETANSHCLHIIEAISNNFPSVIFNVGFASEDFGTMLGEYKMLDGKIVEHLALTPYTKQALEFAVDLRGDIKHKIVDSLECEVYTQDELEEIPDWKETNDNYIRICIERDLLSAKMPKWTLDRAIEICLEGEDFEMCEKIKKLIG